MTKLTIVGLFALLAIIIHEAHGRPVWRSLRRWTWRMERDYALMREEECLNDAALHRGCGDYESAQRAKDAAFGWHLRAAEIAQHLGEE